ncbi:MAG: hypothetical protein ABR585_07900 [Gemmatimonadaceae bacterium]
MAEVAPATVKAHRTKDPDLDAEIKRLMGPLDGRRGILADTSWHAAFLEALARSGSIQQAATEAGVPYGVAYQRRSDARFDEQVQQALAQYAARTQPEEDERWRAIGLQIATAVAAGTTVPKAAADCGIAKHTLNRRRISDSALDEQIQAAIQTAAGMRRQQWLDTWQDPFLAALAEGVDVKDACQAAGVDFARMYAERRQNPDFEAKVRKALADAGREVDAGTRRMLLYRLRQGASLDDALAAAGLTREQLETARAANRSLDQKIRRYVPEGSGHGKAHRAQKLKCPCELCRAYRNDAERRRRARRRLDRFPSEARDAFLALVENGARVVDAAEQVETPWQTIYWVAAKDDGFRARLDAATRAHCTCGGSGGRTGQGRQRCDCPESRQRHARETARARST